VVLRPRELLLKELRLLIRNNKQVSKIKIPPENLETLQKIIQSNVSEDVKQNAIRKYAKRSCCICRGIPIHEVAYDVEQATLQEY
jgi:hypothetical protein